MKPCFFDSVIDDIDKPDNFKEDYPVKSERQFYMLQNYRRLNYVVKEFDLDYRPYSELSEKSKDFNKLIIHPKSPYDIIKNLDFDKSRIMIVAGTYYVLQGHGMYFGKGFRYSKIDSGMIENFLTSSQLS